MKIRSGKTIIAGPEMSTVDVLLASGLADSRNDARRVLTSGGVYINHKQHTQMVTPYTRGECYFIQRGKKKANVAKVYKAYDEAIVELI